MIHTLVTNQTGQATFSVIHLEIEMKPKHNNETYQAQNNIYFSLNTICD